MSFNNIPTAMEFHQMCRSRAPMRDNGLSAFRSDQRMLAKKHGIGSSATYIHGHTPPSRSITPAYKNYNPHVEYLKSLDRKSKFNNFNTVKSKKFAPVCSPTFNLPVKNVLEKNPLQEVRDAINKVQDYDIYII